MIFHIKIANSLEIWRDKDFLGLTCIEKKFFSENNHVT